MAEPTVKKSTQIAFPAKETGTLDSTALSTIPDPNENPIFENEHKMPAPIEISKPTKKESFPSILFF